MKYILAIGSGIGLFWLSSGWLPPWGALTVGLVAMMMVATNMK